MNRRIPSRVGPFACMTITAALALSACGGNTTSDTAASWPSSVTNASWQPATGKLKAVKIVSVSGSVSGADSLLSGGSATLQYSAGGTPPVVVLDYGREVGGLPYFDVSAQSGSPMLSAAFSESRPNATTGDVGAGLTVSVDPNRVSLYPVTTTGTITSAAIQGGERYEAISLTTPGAVTLSAAGIESLYTPPTSTVTGSFASSSDTLNSIWTAGAYTVEMTRLAASSLPLAWQAGSDGVTIGTSGTGIVQKSGNWPSDYTMSFDVRVNLNGAGWVMRNTSNLTSLRFVLRSASDTTGTPDTLEFDAFSTFTGGSTKLASLALPSSVATGTWHTVKTKMSGATIDVSLDGTSIGTLDSAALGASSILLSNYGSAGFFNEPGHQATYRNLSITDASNGALYANALTTSAALDDFSANTNALAQLIDGAKRDRTVWGADIAVAGPTLFYTSNQTDAIAGSIRLLGSYRLANGEVSTTHSPQDPLISGTADTYSSSNFYSAQYSMYFIRLLHDYYQFTGDASLVNEQFAAVQGELGYLQTLVDSNGLISVTAANAQDWLPDFTNPVTGEVTSTNVLYYRTLTEAASLAQALGATSTAATWTAQAAALKTAINAHLYNSATGFYGMSASNLTALAQDANALAVSSGVASSGQAASLLARIADGLASSVGRLAFSSDSGRAVVVSPYASDAEVRARFETGDTKGALALISTLWGNMIVEGDYATGTTWEALNASGQPVSTQTSLAHGWSSGPTSALSRYVLGIRPAAPGYSQWLIKPQTGGLSWVVGSAPTPHGAIAVKWAVSTTGSVAMNVVVPTGTTGTIAVPSGGTVTVNGKAVATASSSALDPNAVASDGGAYRYIDNVGPGTYAIEAGR
ncbi:alpha-L-rhamnosidase C-terminal domain-containing protein [Paraburkholderia sp.]|uniref:alpha-L-rhamnosidase-related protein n=1 Tax=Paraburkholderia sp. TaxID=1926495 RepID=UPI00239D2034|nr:alpha-L-rhamnosidase C-terminal domain-containing protein [Paraburkholderia sp.]MDE1184754.1 alpha-L-rhamnosidase C-terminal domain-containing protein [Paraburkholderia sp.]